MAVGVALLSLSDSFACVPDLCVLYNKSSRSPLSSWTVFALFLEGINPGTGYIGSSAKFAVLGCISSRRCSQWLQVG